MKFLTNIDLQKNQLQNAVIHNSAVSPENSVVGQLYYNTADKALYQYDGTNWVKVGISITDATAGDGIITVDGQDMTVYTHPAHDAATSNLYKITVDALGHVTATTAVTKEDIFALGVEITDTKVDDVATSTSKVITGSNTSGVNTTLLTTDVKDLVLDGITPVEGGFVPDKSSLATAITTLDAAVKDAAAGGELNQDAYSNVKVGSVTLAAASETDTFEIKAGGDVSVEGNATDKTVTVSYSHPTTTAKAAAAVKVGNDAKGHVIIGDALTTNDLTNNSGFITNAVNDLTNYYKKTETYTQTEVNELISEIPKFAIKVVDALPTKDISDTTVYLVKTSETETGNLYTEYIHVNNQWEQLGTQKLSLENYYTKDEVTNRLTKQATATIATTETEKTVTFTGTPISTRVITASGEEVMTDVESKTNSVKVSLAKAYTTALTVTVTYIPTV